MKGLSRLLRAREDAAPGAAAASHDGRECVWVGGEVTQRAVGSRLPGPEAVVQAHRGCRGGGAHLSPLFAPTKEQNEQGLEGGEGKGKGKFKHELLYTS